jgi:GT2 family glycosyltransferase/glycosyltransferase involved in cell wall biosynthesis
MLRRFEAAAAPRASVIVLVYRNADYLEAALRSVLESTDPRFPYEVIVVLNGTTPAVAAQARRASFGARIVVSEANLGFGGGCNLGARHARAPYLVFLNDDVVVRPGWLEELVLTADAHLEAGAVGSRVLNPDGTIQEAGGVIFSDGSTAPVGRGLPESTSRFRALREVDYCSACSLLVRREVFEAVRGFSQRYFPAYYEDVDLALKLRQAGWTVVFQPASELVHIESANTDAPFKSFLFRRNLRTLQSVWAPRLSEYLPSSPRHEVAVQRAMRRARRASADVLIVDDRLPDGGLGSGYGRMSQLLRDIAPARYAVTFFPTCGADDPAAIGAHGVEVVDGDFEAWLAHPATHVDVAIISRPHNWERYATLLRRYHPAAALVYDAEALFHRRIRQQLELEPDEGRRRALKEQFNAAYALESQIARDADHLVCVSPEEARVVRALAPAARIDHLVAVTSGIVAAPARFAQRRPWAAFVAGWMAGPTSPNVDALAWFVRDVLPLVLRRVPEATIVVTGGDPPADVLKLRSASVRFAGFVDSLDDLYANVRAAIAPIRFGAGVKIKTIEAIQYGVPVVATPVGAEGLVLDEPACIAVSDDAAAFADALVRVLSDERDWTHARDAALRQAERWNAPAQTWFHVLERVLERRPTVRATPGTRAALALARDPSDR